MEVKFDRVIFEERTNEFNYSLKENEILGVINGNLSNLFNKKILSGKIVCNDIFLDKSLGLKKLNRYMNLAHFCRNNIENLYSINIMDYINKYIKKVNGAKLYELFKYFKLDKSILEKSYIDLSTSEKKKVTLIIALMIENKIVVFEDPTSYLDYKSQEVLINELKRLKRNKIIVIYTNDTEFLLKTCENILVIDSYKYVIGDKFNILSNEVLLNKSLVKVPDLIMFINKVRNSKNIKLNYSDNINDTIKDVYRNVR